MSGSYPGSLWRTAPAAHQPAPARRGWPPAWISTQKLALPHQLLSHLWWTPPLTPPRPIPAWPPTAAHTEAPPPERSTCPVSPPLPTTIPTTPSTSWRRSRHLMGWWMTRQHRRRGSRGMLGLVMHFRAWSHWGRTFSFLISFLRWGHRRARVAETWTGQRRRIRNLGPPNLIAFGASEVCTQFVMMASFYGILIKFNFNMM